MRSYTERYNAARQAGAKPIILAEVWTDIGSRVYGKQTPPEAQVIGSQDVFIGDDQVFIGTDAVVLEASDSGPFEWEARVLNFGDFRQSLSENSESIVQGIREKMMESYTLTLDNADQKFTELATKEQFLNYKLILRQGFDWPDFELSDFIKLFTGKCTNKEFGVLDFVLTYDQTIETSEIDDPSIDTTKTYSLSNDGAGFTAAQDSFSHGSIAGTFFTEESFTESFNVDLDAVGAQTIFAITNGAYNQDRWEVGIDSGNYLYFRYTDNVDTATPTFKTITTGFTVSPGTMNITIDLDVDAEIITICDGNGNCHTDDIPLGPLGYDSQFGSIGTGNGQFRDPFNAAIDNSGNIFVTDSSNDRVQKFTSEGVYVSQFGSSGSGNGQFSNGPGQCAFDSAGNIFVTDPGNDRIQKFSSGGSYISQFGSSGSGNGQFNNPFGIAIDGSGNIFVADTLNNRIQKFSSGGSYISQFGSSGSGNGQFSYPFGLAFDSGGNIFVIDSGNDRVQQFTAAGAYLSQFGSSGSGNGQFGFPIGIDVDISTDDIYVADTDNNRLQIFDSTGAYLSQFGSYGSGNGQFDVPQGVVVGDEDFVLVTDSSNNRVQKLVASLALPDFQNTGDLETLTVFGNSNGTIASAAHNSNTSGAQTNPASTEFWEVATGDGIDLVDGNWEEYGNNQTYTSTPTAPSNATAFDTPILPTAGRYNNPGNNQQNLILPLPYGDLTENSDTGVWVAPLIDYVNYVYCASGWAVLSVANGNVISVYVDGILTASGWTFDESNDYESQGDIATLTFSADQGDSVITIRMSGREDSPGSGTLLTDPIDIIEDWMDYAAELIGSGAWQKDPTTFAAARSRSQGYGYTCAGVIQANNTMGFWLQSMLNSFLGYFRFDIDGKVQVFLTPKQAEPNVQEWLDEWEEISIRIKENPENIINRVIINYAIAYVKIDRRYKEGGESSYFRTADESSDSSSIQRYSEHVQPFDFDWTRNAATVATCIQILLDLYEFPELILSYQGQDFKYMPLELGDAIEATISLVLDLDKSPVEGVQYELREKIQNLDDFTTTFTAQSIGYRRSLESQTVNIGDDAVFIGENEVQI